MKYLMNLEFKKAASIFLMVCMFFAGKSQGITQDTPEFDRLKSSFENNRVFAATFSHEYNDGFTGEQQTTDGQIWIGKEHYKIEGDTQQMVVDGKTSTVYDGQKNRVIVSEYIEEEDDFAPSRMLQGVDSSYTVSEEQLEDETLITLTSEDPFSVFMEVFIYLDMDGNPLRIEAIDQADNELITEFTTGSFTQADEEMFELEIPDGAEYIDLRNETR